MQLQFLHDQLHILEARQNIVIGLDRFAIAIMKKSTFWLNYKLSKMVIFSVWCVDWGLSKPLILDSTACISRRHPGSSFHTEVNVWMDRGENELPLLFTKSVGNRNRSSNIFTLYLTFHLHCDQHPLLSLLINNDSS